MRHVVPLLALLAAPAVAQQLQWVQSPVNGHWYAATPATLNWTASESLAVSLGGHLATVRSTSENSWILTTFSLSFSGPTPSIWIGYADNKLEGTWLWTSGEVSLFTNWGIGEPTGKNPTEDFCTLVGGTWGSLVPGDWNDDYDTKSYYGLIEVASGDCDGDGVPDIVELSQGGTDPCLPLSADTTSISVTTGGVQQFTLNAGLTSGLQPYLVLGTLSGTSPGLPVDGLLLPLFPDSYFIFTLTNPNSTALTSTFGTLAINGSASAALNVPAGMNPAFAGIVAHHAYAVFDLTTTPGQPFVSFVSNAVGLGLVP